MAKKDKEWKAGKGIKGTVRAAITHHPDKFDADCKDPDRLCPYAIFSAMKKKGFEPHYKDQKSTLKGEPKKKAKFKESGYYSFKEYCDFREALDGVSTLILWGSQGGKPMYKGKAGNQYAVEEYIVSARSGYGSCYFIDAVNVAEAKSLMDQAMPTTIPNVFVYGERAVAAIAKWGKPK